MPAFTIVDPDRVHYPALNAASPIHALHELHAEALGRDAVALLDGVLVFADPDDAALCAGVWKVTELARNGSDGSTTKIRIAMPVPVAA